MLLKYYLLAFLALTLPRSWPGYRFSRMFSCASYLLVVQHVWAKLITTSELRYKLVLRALFDPTLLTWAPCAVLQTHASCTGWSACMRITVQRLCRPFQRLNCCKTIVWRLGCHRDTGTNDLIMQNDRRPVLEFAPCAPESGLVGQMK